MKNKKLTIFEQPSNGIVKDTANLKATSIILTNPANGKVLFRGSNKVIVSGSEFNAIKDFDFDGFDDLFIPEILGSPNCTGKYYCFDTSQGVG